MARNFVETSHDQSDQLPGEISATFNWRSLATWPLTIILVTGSWLLVHSILRAGAAWPVRLILFLVLPAIITVTLERSLASVQIDRPRRYRSAFLAGAVLSAAGLFGSWGLLTAARHLNLAQAAAIFPAAGLALTLTGAFFGGLAATSLNEPLWENNSPPSAEIQAAVYRRHANLIGSPPKEPLDKRAFDLLMAGTGLLLSSPVWLFIALLVWLEDPGPVLFIKNSVGKGGRNFQQFKFRTMVRGAEQNTGPILSHRGDKRVLWIGRVLRKTALDELPQFINILRGEMSFVGPRPQRTVLVQGYIDAIPEYTDRHRVLPGLSGLAQVAGDYYLSPRQKLRFDRLYICHRSLGFDLKLLWLAFMITFWLRWQKDWRGRLPRRWLRWGIR